MKKTNMDWNLHWIGPLGRFSHGVTRSAWLLVCLFVCLWQFKTPTYGGCGDFWSKGLSLILGCNDTILVFFRFDVSFLCVSQLFLGFWSQPTASQSTVYNGGVSRGWVPLPLLTPPSLPPPHCPGRKVNFEANYYCLRIFFGGPLKTYFVIQNWPRKGSYWLILGHRIFWPI